MKKETKCTIIPDTPTARLLRSINVRPGQISELADVPLAWAEAALADANARDGIKSIPSWVVSLLRDARDQGYTIGGDPASAETVMSDERVTELATAFRQETPTTSRPTTIPPALWDSLPAWLHALLDGATVTPERVTARTPWQQDQLASRGAHMVRALLAALPARDPMRAFERALLAAEPLPATPPAETTPAIPPVDSLPAPSPAAPTLAMLPAAPAPAAPVPAPLPVTLAPPTPVPPPTPAADAAVLPPPPWVRCPDQWACQPRLVQAALAGATEQDGQIVGANPFLTKQIQTRYGHAVAALRGEEVP